MSCPNCQCSSCIQFLEQFNLQNQGTLTPLAYMLSITQALSEKVLNQQGITGVQGPNIEGGAK